MFNMLETYNKSLWHGYTQHSALSLFVKIMSIKFSWNVVHSGVDQVLQLMQECAQLDSCALTIYYKAMLVIGLDLISVKMD